MRGRETPEQGELRDKQDLLASVTAELADAELRLASLTEDLKSFEAAYVRRFGPLWAEIDDLKAQLAEAEAALAPADQAKQKTAFEAREQAHESATAAQAALQIAIRVRKTDDELKQLYRELAKRIHPDLSTSEPDHLRRERLMAEVNDAYSKGEKERLRRILDDLDMSPEAVEGEDIAAELVRTIRRIAQVRRRLEQISKEIADLEQAEIFHLWHVCNDGRAKGKDVLSEMEMSLRYEIRSLNSDVQTKDMRASNETHGK